MDNLCSSRGIPRLRDTDRTILFCQERCCYKYQNEAMFEGNFDFDNSGFKHRITVLYAIHGQH